MLPNYELEWHPRHDSVCCPDCAVAKRGSIAIVRKNIRVRCFTRTFPRLVAVEGKVSAIMLPKRQKIHGASLKRYELI